ncbi:aspartate/glutamate racemase family protein [Marivita sp. GX14005]|uniref:maleate cis-trans isomerase family protein n=1 Tax=Marivita sp. GX14005 TaxID=2942276 RepID=UPI002019FD2B|nr:aspartate/glutamate racemase family protein [Marivita sp. GX14005]MCL3883113.1 aspartate/glutamate racemase family protein [Marivita sp. GX14005]
MTTRLGMLTPSSNTVLEPVCAEMAAALPDTSVHFSRFTVTRIAMDDAALGQFDTSPMVNAAKLLADAKVDAIAWNGTSASWLGLDSDRKLVREIESEAGVPAATCVLSVMDALDALGAKTIGLVTPYTDDVQQKIIDNFAAHGLRCTAEAHFDISDNFSFGTVPQDRIESALRDVCGAKPDAVIVLCTNLAGAPVARRIEEETGVPILDSISVTMWGALNRIGARTGALAPWGPKLAELKIKEPETTQ